MKNIKMRKSEVMKMVRQWSPSDGIDFEIAKDKILHDLKDQISKQQEEHLKSFYHSIGVLISKSEAKFIVHFLETRQ